MITVVPLTKHAWQLVSVDAALKIVTVAEAEPVRMASVSVGMGRRLAAVVEMGGQLSISISSRSAALLLEEHFGRGKLFPYLLVKLCMYSNIHQLRCLCLKYMYSFHLLI